MDTTSIDFALRLRGGAPAATGKNASDAASCAVWVGGVEVYTSILLVLVLLVLLVLFVQDLFGLGELRASEIAETGRDGGVHVDGAASGQDMRCRYAREE